MHAYQNTLCLLKIESIVNICPSYIWNRTQADMFAMIYVVQGCVGPEETGEGWQQQLINNSAQNSEHLYEHLSKAVCKPTCLPLCWFKQGCLCKRFESFCCVQVFFLCRIWDNMRAVRLCTCPTAGFVSRWWISTSGKVALWPQAFPGCSLSAVIVWRLKSSPLIKLPGSQACVTLHRCLAQLLEHHTGVIPYQQGPT